MTSVPAYAATSATGPLVPGTVERRDVGPKDVRIDIRWAGICHSDIHTVNGDWGPQPFPVVPGHEIVGVVAEVGSDVTRHRVGEIIGVGCMVGSCGPCDNCRSATHVVVDADHMLTVPAGLNLAIDTATLA